MFKFNLNHYVVVQLKPEGEKAVLDYTNQYVKDYSLIPAASMEQLLQWKRVKNGYWTFQMHEFMNIFGSYLHIGFDHPLYLDIYFYEEDMETVDDPRTAL